MVFTITYIYHKNQPTVGKYTVRPMDPFGLQWSFDFELFRNYPTNRHRKFQVPKMEVLNLISLF